MAKKDKEPKKVLERTYNVPLRREWLKVPRHKRAKKAAKALREFIIRHMKPELDEKGKPNIKILKHANLELWKHGIKNPPHHIKINTVKDDKGKVLVELFGKPLEEEKLTEEKEKKKPETGEEKKKETIEKKAEEAKKEEKKEIEEAKEQPDVLPKQEQPEEPKEFKPEKPDQRAPRKSQGIARGEHRAKAEKNE